MLKQKDLVDRMAKKGYTKKDATCIIDDMFTTIMEAMAEGESVQIHGFGTFSVRDAAAHEARDLQTGESIMIPEHKAPRFVPGMVLKRTVKDGVYRE